MNLRGIQFRPYHSSCWRRKASKQKMVQGQRWSICVLWSQKGGARRSLWLEKERQLTGTVRDDTVFVV